MSRAAVERPDAMLARVETDQVSNLCDNSYTVTLMMCSAEESRAVFLPLALTRPEDSYPAQNDLIPVVVITCSAAAWNPQSSYSA